MVFIGPASLIAGWWQHCPHKQVFTAKLSVHWACIYTDQWMATSKTGCSTSFHQGAYNNHRLPVSTQAFQWWHVSFTTPLQDGTPVTFLYWAVLLQQNQQCMWWMRIWQIKPHFILFLALFHQGIWLTGGMLVPTFMQLDYIMRIFFLFCWRSGTLPQTQLQQLCTECQNQHIKHTANKGHVMVSVTLPLFSLLRLQHWTPWGLRDLWAMHTQWAKLLHFQDCVAAIRSQGKRVWDLPSLAQHLPWLAPCSYMYLCFLPCNVFCQVSKMLPQVVQCAESNSEHMWKKIYH